MDQLHGIEYGEAKLGDDISRDKKLKVFEVLANNLS